MVEHSTATNRAVNIPEFVNIPAGGLLKIDAPVTEYYRLIDLGTDALNGGRIEEALPLLRQAVESSPDDAEARNSADTRSPPRDASRRRSRSSAPRSA